MKQEIADPCFPNDSDFPSLYRVVMDARPVDAPYYEDGDALYEEAVLAMVAEGCWTGPNGTCYEALYHARWDDMIVGYRKLREKDWFIRTVEGDEEKITGPFKTKRACIRRLGEKRSTTIEAGYYLAGKGAIFTRDMAKRVIGREI